MIILIDNYDSFTFNIYHYLSEVENKIKVFRNDEITLNKINKMKPKAIIISPGPKRPENAGICLELIKENINIPILGICLGNQCIGQAYGASIIKAKEIMHGKIDTINHLGHKIFEGIEKKFNATRYHSLIIDKKTLPSELKIIAETKSGVIMGIAHKKKKIIGLQFHPESIGTTVGKVIFKNFHNLINNEY